VPKETENNLFRSVCQLPILHRVIAKSEVAVEIIYETVIQRKLCVSRSQPQDAIERQFFKISNIFGMLEIPNREEFMPLFRNRTKLCFFLRGLLKLPNAESVFLCFTCYKESIILLAIVVEKVFEVY
jgi:hypothetical protein